MCMGAGIDVTFRWVPIAPLQGGGGGGYCPLLPTYCPMDSAQGVAPLLRRGTLMPQADLPSLGQWEPL